jgi:hypothetical protein
MDEQEISECQTNCVLFYCVYKSFSGTIFYLAKGQHNSNMIVESLQAVLFTIDLWPFIGKISDVACT